MVLRAHLALILMIGLLFLTAGTWQYWQAWVYFIINMVILVRDQISTRTRALVKPVPINTLRQI